MAGGIAGLTLGLGTAAGITLGVGETVAANAGANVIGGEVQRQADAALGNGAAPTGLKEAAAVTIDAVAGGVGGLVGGRIADEAFPLPNVRKEIEILKFANRRSTRAAQIQSFNKAVDRQAALYPHRTLDVTVNARKQSTRLLRIVCPACGYTARTTRHWLDRGLPTCPCGSLLTE